MSNPYEDLGNAIILQAVKDYRKLPRFRNDALRERARVSLEQFFLSEWYATLTQLNGEKLLARLRAEVGV